MRTLLLARHAKSSWDQPGVSDFYRCLNARGESDAPVMAAYLKQCGYLIHQIVSSDAVRALATADEYKKALLPEKDMITHHDLYLASQQEIVQIAQSLCSQDNTVMMVGHNPGITQALNYFTQAGIDNMPTCSVAIIQFDVMEWQDIVRAGGDLLAFEYPEKTR